MVLAVASPSRGQNNVFLEQEGGKLGNGDAHLRPRTREITSRYKSPSPGPGTLGNNTNTIPSTSRRFPSPVVGRSSSNGGLVEPAKRALSAERKRLDSPASTSDSKTKIPSRTGTPNAASRIWPPSQKLSQSMQSEGGLFEKKQAGIKGDHSLKPATNRGLESPARRRNPTPEKKTPTTPDRKSTPVRRLSSDHSENARPRGEVNRWPGASSPKISNMTKSMDFSSEKDRSGIRGGLAIQGRTVNCASRPVRTPAPPIRSKSIDGPLPESPSSVSRTMIMDSRTKPGGKPGGLTGERSSPGGLTGGERASLGGLTGGERSSLTGERSSLAGERSSPKTGTGILSLKTGTGILSPKTATGILSPGTPRERDFVRELPDETVLATSADASDTESISSAGSAATSASSVKKFSQRRDKLRTSLSEQDFSSAIAAGRRVKSLSVSSGSLSTTPWSLSPGPGRLSSTSQPPSPSKSVPTSSSPFRSIPSPSRSRISPFQLPPSGQTGRPSTSSSLLNFPIRGGKKAMSQLEEAQAFRLLHNRWLQWRFVNARAEAARNTQKAIAERTIYNAWLQTSDLRKSVAMSRIKLQHARGILKVQSILASQGPLLEIWGSLQQEHSAALSGSLDALEAAALRVPVTGGAKADVQAIREALGFAVDVTGSLKQSLDSLMPKTERMSGMVLDLAEVAKQEQLMLGKCTGILGNIAALEVEERSLQTHFMQVECENFKIRTRQLDRSDELTN